MIAFVSGSSPVELDEVLDARSAWLPTLITAESPISSGRLQSTMVVMIAPLCEMKAIFPGLGETGSKVVLMPWWGSMSPRQFGPTIRYRTPVR